MLKIQSNTWAKHCDEMASILELSSTYHHQECRKNEKAVVVACKGKGKVFNNN